MGTRGAAAAGGWHEDRRSWQDAHDGEADDIVNEAQGDIHQAAGAAHGACYVPLRTSW
ncbi:hypothetical protein QJS66_14205 [Kocuria rhizophila]|nr:hypothetical protein QJS66_14205 [Kocuria rhizophila]